MRLAEMRTELLRRADAIAKAGDAVVEAATSGGDFYAARARWRRENRAADRLIARATRALSARRARPS